MVTREPKPKLTYEDYAKTPEGERWELIDGELFMAPSPKEAHQRSQLRIGSRMLTFSEQADLGRVYTEFDVLLSSTDTVRPDVIFVSNGRLDIITEDNIQGAPDLIVEIRSPSTARRDWTTKRELYARHGVEEYWLVDPEAATVALLHLEEGELKVAGVYGEGDTVTSAVLTGFSVALADIFRP
jgi:Uma2 family endonuclease